jgi:hypothetical protein
VIALAIAGLSRVPASPEDTSEALLRLSWRVLGARVEECRARTAEELAALAPHMRTPQVCTGRGAGYELRVRVDGAEAIRDTIRPAGARGDRPVYVFRDLVVEPGSHEVGVEFTALVPRTYQEGEQEVLEYGWAGDILVAPAEIALITLDESGGTLIYRAR